MACPFSRKRLGCEAMVLLPESPLFSLLPLINNMFFDSTLTNTLSDLSSSAPLREVDVKVGQGVIIGILTASRHQFF
jgi:hypothetical protein